MTQHDDKTLNDDARGLEVLAAPAPRRTDDAFSRSVADDVARVRGRSWRPLWLPALAATAAVVGFVVSRPDGAGPVALIANPDAVEDELASFADVDPDLFTLPTLDGSSDGELLAFEARLDLALGRQKL